MSQLSTRAREAIKTGLAMVIGYWLAMRMGWDNPFWVPLTVVTLNMMTTGQSLPRSILRSSGTLVGGVAALVIMGLVPQDRFGFMIALSVYVGFCTYMFKGKSFPYFWFLAALTCLIIPFKSMPLDSATAFQEAWLRTVETATGALVWILVAAFLWPRSSVGPFNEAGGKLWAIQARLYQTYRALMSGQGTAEESAPLRLQEAQLLTQVGQLLDAAEADSHEVWEARHMWRRFLNQSAALMQALERWRNSFREIQPLDLTKLLPNLKTVSSELDLRFAQIARMLANEDPTRTAQPVTLAVDKVEMRALTRFEQAAVTVTGAHLENIERLTGSLFECVENIRGYGSQAAKPATKTTPRGGLAIDPDRLRAVGVVLATQWSAFFLWVYINPPTGAGFVMMTTIIALIMQLAPPAKAPMQYFAWGSGAALAGIMYVFVMPHLSSFGQLAVLIFAANAVMYYIFGEPRLTLLRMLCMASFAVLLMIDNQQSYSFTTYTTLTVGLIMLPITLAGAIAYMTTSGRPEKEFLRLLRRFFRRSEFLIARMALDWEQEKGFAGRWKTALYRNDLLGLPEKLEALGPQIDYRLLPGSTPQQVQALVSNLHALAFRIEDLVEARRHPQSDLIVKPLLDDFKAWRTAIEERFQRRADETALPVGEGGDLEDRLKARLARMEARIGETFAEVGEGDLSVQDCGNFYRLLGSFRGLSEAAIGYGRLADKFNWAPWREARF